MSDREGVKDSGPSPAQSGDAGVTAGAEQFNQSLSARIGYGAPERSSSTDDNKSNTIDNRAKPGDSTGSTGIGTEPSNQPLSVRIGYGAPENLPRTDGTSLKPGDAGAYQDFMPSDLPLSLRIGYGTPDAYSKTDDARATTGYDNRAREQSAPVKPEDSQEPQFLQIPGLFDEQGRMEPQPHPDSLLQTGQDTPTPQQNSDSSQQQQQQDTPPQQNQESMPVQPPQDSTSSQQNQGQQSRESVRHHGINLNGAEFGQNIFPGKLGQDYVFPTTPELDYYKQKGMDMVRIPFLWERMQPGLMNKTSPDASVDRSFDSTYSGEMDKFLTAADQRGMNVVLDAQQFGRYKDNVIGTSNITNDDFKQFWQKMSQTYGQHSSVYGYDLSNEPHDEDDKTWQGAAQAGVDGIRAAGDKHAVVIEGNQYAGTASWNQHSKDLAVNDPANNVIYEAHSYWDSDHSGSYQGGAQNSYDKAVADARSQNMLGSNEDPSNLGVNDAKPFVDWLKANNAKGYIGEYGVPSNDQNWVKMQDKFLAYTKENNIDTTAWGGGPFWGNEYVLSLETGPKNEQSINGPEPLNLKSVTKDGDGSTV